MLRRQVPSTNSLFTFEIVARLGSFSAAAKELNVTQPAISRAISGLETHLGYSLFHRRGRWIEMTQNGDRLFRATSTAFNTVSETLREIGHQNESQDTVSISMSTTSVNHWFLPRMRRFKMNFPAVNLTFQMFNAGNDGIAKDVDLWVRLSSPDDVNMHRWPFADERILALCSPGYLAEYGSLDHPIKGRLHTALDGAQQRYSLEEYLHATGRVTLGNQRSFRFSDFATTIQAALQGQGIALAWASETSHQIIAGNLVPACTQVVKTGRRHHILASNLTPMRAVVEDIRDWLIKEMRNDMEEINNVLRARLTEISPQ
ncbi:MAG: LysR family transcriptional regulator [Rhodobacteraceae bacterium]|nr:LysR family transcriptional regulator [Paracoccaceae bacterium]